MKKLNPLDLNKSSVSQKPENAEFQVPKELGVPAMVLAPFVDSKSANRAGGEAATGSSQPLRIPENQLEEAIGLAEAIELDVCESAVVRLNAIKSATLLGPGKVEELRGIIRAQKIEVVIVDFSLTPVQQRNLERAWSTKVLDRTGLILEIFGRRAKTREGRLQVDHAHLTYQKSRLVRSWTHLERQRGGGGFMGGPGETQIEADRRQIETRIKSIEKNIARVKRTRDLHRRGRKRVPYPVVSLVGYTNAGKSTLFNRLTKANVIARDALFETLDPTMREVVLPSGQKIILSDTVGFISDLPTTLIAAFRATLEEVIEADLILHVRDIHHAESEQQRQSVYQVLKELGVDPENSTAKFVEVWNKIDLLDSQERDVLFHQAARQQLPTFPISAVNGQSIAELLAQIDDLLQEDHRIVRIVLGSSEGRMLNWIYQNGEVQENTYLENGDSSMTVKFAPNKLGQLKQRSGNIQITAVD